MKSKPCCISIEKGVGILSVLSIVLGATMISLSVQEIVIVIDTPINCTELNIKLKIDVVGAENSTYKKLIDIKDISLKKFNLDYYHKFRSVWLGAAFSGVVCGIMQASISVWFILNICSKKKQRENTKWWTRCQLVSTCILMTTFGALIIQGFYPEEIIRCFVADFILTNIFVWLSIPILRGNSDVETKHVLSGPLWSAMTF